MFPGTKNRNGGTFGCSPVPKTGTRAQPPFYEKALLFPLEKGVSFFDFGLFTFVCICFCLSSLRVPLSETLKSAIVCVCARLLAFVCICRHSGPFYCTHFCSTLSDSRESIHRKTRFAKRVSLPWSSIPWCFDFPWSFLTTETPWCFECF